MDKKTMKKLIDIQQQYAKLKPDRRICSINETYIHLCVEEFVEVLDWVDSPISAVYHYDTEYGYHFELGVKFEGVEIMALFTWQELIDTKTMIFVPITLRDQFEHDVRSQQEAQLSCQTNPN